MNNLEKIYHICDEIEKRYEYLFCLWPLVNGNIGLDVLDYDSEEKIDGGIFKTALEVIDFLEEHYV